MMPDVRGGAVDREPVRETALVLAEVYPEAIMLLAKILCPAMERNAAKARLEDAMARFERENLD